MRRCDHERRLQRRSFLQAVSAGLAGATAYRCSDDDPIEPPPNEVREYEGAVHAYFDDAEDFENAAFVGRVYVRQQDWSSSEAYESTERTREFIDDVDSDSETTDELEQRLEQDFADLRVRPVSGWTLSRTETELCVLAYLVQQADTEE